MRSGSQHSARVLEFDLVVTANPSNRSAVRVNSIDPAGSLHAATVSRPSEPISALGSGRYDVGRGTLRKN